jgi:glucosyl-3-phosphoglycerate synthase
MLTPLVDELFVQRLVVIDGGSNDSTADIATSAGAVAFRAAEILPQYGPLLGKGDAVWRGASLIVEDVLVFVDGDIFGDMAGMTRALVAPILRQPGAVRFVKGYFRRAASVEELERPHEQQRLLEGGRVTEIVARPLIKAIAPHLTMYHEPLSGQIAIERSVLRALPIVTGYGLEIGMLFDIVSNYGHQATAQADLGTIFNPPQSESALEAMADEVTATLLDRVERSGGLPLSPAARKGLSSGAPTERPPLEWLTTVTDSPSDEGQADGQPA